METDRAHKAISVIAFLTVQLVLIIAVDRFIAYAGETTRLFDYLSRIDRFPPGELFLQDIDYDLHLLKPYIRIILALATLGGFLVKDRFRYVTGEVVVTVLAFFVFLTIVMRHYKYLWIC